jgi:D-glycero-alpha-D-manno-heptose-7-phosphate kinase
LWPIWAFLGSAKTYNLAIDLFASAQLSLRQDFRVLVSLEEHLFQFSSAESFLSAQDSRLSLAQVVYRFVFLEGKKIAVASRHFGFDLQIRSESPRGAGLGGSSALICSLLKVFLEAAEYLGYDLPSPVFSKSRTIKCAATKQWSIQDWVHWAHHLEARVLKTPTGVQDYVPALMGGLCEVSLSPRGLGLVHLPHQQTWLDFIRDRSFLIYTGAPHHSGINNFEVLSRLVRGEEMATQAVVELSELSKRLGEILNQQTPFDGAVFDGAVFFRQELSARLKLSPVFSSPEIEKILTAFSQDLGVGVKICGAGGGGCVMLWVNDPAKKASAQELCQKLGFQILSSSPVSAFI